MKISRKRLKKSHLQNSQKPVISWWIFFLLCRFEIHTVPIVLQYAILWADFKIFAWVAMNTLIHWINYYKCVELFYKWKPTKVIAMYLSQASPTNCVVTTNHATEMTMMTLSTFPYRCVNWMPFIPIPNFSFS